MNLGAKTEKYLFIICAALVTVFFFWSRLDFSHRIHYFGDGNVIVELIKLILSSHDWDPNWMRLKSAASFQPEFMPLVTIPSDMEIFYNLSGYTVIGAAICKILYAAGFSEWPIQSVLRGFNVTLQIATLLLLFVAGKKLLHQWAGILAAVLFVVFPLVVMEAHYERPETWLCFLLTALLCCCLYFPESPRRYSALIGVLIGLSAATKMNQLFMLMMPGLLLIHLWLAPAAGTVTQKSKEVFMLGGLVLLCMAATVVIHTPFLITHASETLAGLKSQSGFYNSQNYPYSEESYTFSGQLFVSFRYLWFTLGATWCGFLLAGMIFLATEYLKNPLSKKSANLIIILPIVFLFIFSSLLSVFLERTFSSIEGLLCLVTAVGFIRSAQQLQKIKSAQKMLPALITAGVLLLIFTPLRINYLFVDRYIQHPDKPQRIVFQETLKKDFHKFWIKNVFFSYKILGKIPEQPGKAPRLYQVDDLNEHWTKSYLAMLGKNGFRKVAVYCSEFSDQPPNTLTIYHAAAKNHYFVRIDEWPAGMPTDYFKTNCQ